MSYIPHDLNGLAKGIHEFNVEVGWWDAFPERKDRVVTARGLTLSELGEAINGARKDAFDDHLSHRKALWVELADVIIRVLDMGAAINHQFVLSDDVIQRSAMWHSKKRNPIEQIDRIAEYMYMSKDPSIWLTATIEEVLGLCKLRNIPIWRVVDEKFTYNRHRADHKRAAREASNGKKW